MTNASHCIHHPYKEATARCKRCNIPLCDECKVVTAEGSFCSETCHSQMKAFMERAKELDKDVRKPRARFPALKWIVFVLILAVIVFVLRYRFDVRGFADFRDLIMRAVNAFRHK